MIYDIATISGDGIGPEIISSAKKVLTAIGKKYDAVFNFEEAPMGGIAIDTLGTPMPQSSVDVCKKASAVLLGAVGGPKWDNAPVRPEKALLGIRKELGLYANYRQAVLYPELKFASPLKESLLADGIDAVMVRELTGGIYFGERGYRIGKYGREAFDTECISELEAERIARSAFELAQTRKKRLVSVDKANVLESSRLWRKIVHDINEDYPDVTVEDMLVDNCAMQLARNPSRFDVIVTSNMFGDILSDLMAALLGSIGLMPSASVGNTSAGLYEPIHGSAPDIAGTGTANPLATILSAAMMLRLSLNMEEAARDVENAVKKALADGYRTPDIYTDNFIKTGTERMTEVIISNILV